MTWYSDLPGRRSRQLLADAAMLLWALLWARAGMLVADRTAALLAPAGSLVSAGESITEGMSSAGSEVGSLPYVGDGLRSSFDRLASTGESVAQAGRDLAVSGERLGLLLGLLTTAATVLPVLALWLPARLRFALGARRLSRDLASVAAPQDLLALRALAGRPLAELARVDPDPLGAWREGDEEVTARLAALELRAAGLSHRRLPRAGRGEVMEAAAGPGRS